MTTSRNDLTGCLRAKQLREQREAGFNSGLELGRAAASALLGGLEEVVTPPPWMKSAEVAERQFVLVDAADNDQSPTGEVIPRGDR